VLLLKNLKRFIAARSEADCIALLDQIEPEQFADVLVVVADTNLQIVHSAPPING
jgi:hypothetical protein